MGRIFPNGPVVALTLLTLALAGCGSVHAGTGSPGGAASTSARSESQSPQARAKADAAAILAAFVPPPGAFQAGTRGPTIATAFAKSNGCGGVQRTLGVQRTMLGWASSVAQ